MDDEWEGTWGSSWTDNAGKGRLTLYLHGHFVLTVNRGLDWADPTSVQINTEVMEVRNGHVSNG